LQLNKSLLRNCNIPPPEDIIPDNPSLGETKPPKNFILQKDVHAQVGYISTEQLRTLELGEQSREVDGQEETHTRRDRDYCKGRGTLGEIRYG